MAEKMNKAKNKEDDKAEDKANEASEQTVGNGDTATGASEQSANTDTAAGSIRQNAPQAASGGNSGGPSGPSQSQSNRSGSGGGGRAAYLAKALLMSIPAGSIIEAYGKGRNLAGGFDKAIHGEIREQETQPQLQQVVSQVAQIHEAITLLGQDYYNRQTQQPNNNGNDDEHSRD